MLGDEPVVDGTAVGLENGADAREVVEKCGALKSATMQLENSRIE